jgi:hypothetical protein
LDAFWPQCLSLCLEDWNSFLRYLHNWFLSMPVFNSCFKSACLKCQRRLINLPLIINSSEISNVSCLKCQLLNEKKILMSRFFF